MLRTTLLTSLAVFTLLLLFATAHAQEEAQLPLTLESLEANLHTKLLVESVSGIHDLLQPETGKLLALEMTFAPPWTEEVDKVKIAAKDIFLALADEQRLDPIGSFRRYGQFRIESPTLDQRRPSKWKENPLPLRLSLVFLIPDGQTSAVLHVGENQFEVAVPAQAGPVPNPADTLTVEVLNATLEDSVESVFTLNKMKLQTTASNPEGKLLALRLRLTPTRANGERPDNFFWYTNWFQLAYDGGHHAPIVGERFMDKLADSVSHTLNQNNDGSWQSREVTLYFAVPKGTKTYSLIYLFATVAQGEVR